VYLLSRREQQQQRRRRGAHPGGRCGASLILLRSHPEGVRKCARVAEGANKPGWRQDNDWAEAGTSGMGMEWAEK
jgi:hypothetical protein